MISLQKTVTAIIMFPYPIVAPPSLLDYYWRFFHTSISWWFSTGVWVTASLLKSPGLVSGFWLILTILYFGYELSKFLIRSLLIFIIKGFRTIVFIFIVISATFQLICPPAFFRCLLSKFLRWSLLIFIIKGFRTIVFIFIVISKSWQPTVLWALST